VIRAVIAAVSLLVACGGPSRSAAPAPVPAPVPAAGEPAQTWLELAGAHMLVTTTRAAAGRTDAELPILVVLPWSGSTPAEALAEVGYLDLDAPARIVAIRGFEPHRNGYSWWVRAEPDTSTAAAADAADAELARLLDDRAARLIAILGEVQRHFGAPSPPVVSGISQGADLAIAFGTRSPAAITAALPIAARFPEALWPAAAPAGAAAPPIDVFQGTADVPAPFPAIERAVAVLAERGFPIALHAYPGVGHDIAPALRADVLACAALRLRGSRAACGTNP
jgi:phospholipase/carboxylesterase